MAHKIGAIEYRIGIGSDLNLQPTRYRTKLAAKKAAQRFANKERRPVTIFKGQYQNVGYFEYDEVDHVWPKEKRVGNSGETTTMSDWVPCHAYRKLPDGTVQVLKETGTNVRQVNSGRGKRVPNIAQGFWANGVFHPIRASSDYDESRVGEGGKKRKPAKKVAAKKRTPAKKKAPAKKRRAISIPKPRSMSRNYYE